MLHQIVLQHFEPFRAQAASLRDGEGLPRFVKQEFRNFLRCGWLAGGFARFRCTACGLDRLVAFSCKGRGFWASGRDMFFVGFGVAAVGYVIGDVMVRF